jgi:hypothetical protein
MNSIKAAARRAGVLYLLLAIIGPFNTIYVPGRFIVAEDPTATARNITVAELTYRIGILSELVADVVFLVLVLSLYDLLKDAGSKKARLMVVLVSVGVAIGIVNLLNEAAPLVLLNGGGFWSVFTKAQLDAFALGFLRLRNVGNNIDFVFWGLWLFPFGILVIRSGFFPKFLGVLLIVGGFAYVVGSVTALVLPAHARVVSQVTLPLAAPGELLMIVWLLVKGVKAPLTSSPGMRSA